MWVSQRLPSSASQSTLTVATKLCSWIWLPLVLPSIEKEATSAAGIMPMSQLYGDKTLRIFIGKP